MRVASIARGYAALSLAYMGGLFYLSSLPGSAAGPDGPTWRIVSNAAHVPLFAGLGVCLALAFGRWPAGPGATAMLVVGAAYAIFDEWHQSWVPDRSASALDIVLDLAGLALVIVARTVAWRRPGPVVSGDRP